MRYSRKLSIFVMLGLINIILNGNTPVMADENQTHLKEIGHIETGSNAFYTSIHLNICVVSEGSYGGIILYDITDPRNPIELSRIKNGTGYPHNTIIHNDHVFLADTVDGVEIYSINNPENPILLSSTYTGGYAWDIELHQGDLYVVDNIQGLLIYNIQDLHNLNQIGYYNQTGFSNLYIKDDIAYITAFDSGLFIIDISNPNNPSLISYYDQIESPTQIIIKDDLAYVSQWDNGISILDISDPVNLFEVSSLDIGRSVGIGLRVEILWVCNWYDGIQLINISDPMMPTVLLEYSSTKESKNVLIREDVVYVSDGYNGLVLLETRFPQVEKDTVEPNDSDETQSIPAFPLSSILIGLIFSFILTFRKKLTFERIMFMGCILLCVSSVQFVHGTPEIDRARHRHPRILNNWQTNDLPRKRG